MIEFPAAQLSPEGLRRLEKYGSTLNDENVHEVCAHIADYPEIHNAVTAHLAAILADPETVEAVTGEHWLIFKDGRVTGCHCGFAAPPPSEDWGYGDSVIAHIVRAAIAVIGARIGVAL